MTTKRHQAAKRRLKTARRSFERVQKEIAPYTHTPVIDDFADQGQWIKPADQELKKKPNQAWPVMPIAQEFWR
jgi:hypothetical protein